MRLRIGIFQDAFYPMVDGVCQVVDHYARELQKEADVTVFVPSVPGKAYDDSVFPYRVVRCRALSVPLIDYCLPAPLLDSAFRRAVRETELDLIHIHSPFTIGKLGLREARRRGIPSVATMHSQFRRDFQRAVKSDRLALMMTHVLIRTFEMADECWAVNAAMARLYHEEYGYSKVPRVMQNATDLVPAKDPAAARRRAEETFSIDPKDRVFLFVGRLNNLKNVFLIAESLRYVKEQADFPFKMLFLGTGQDEKALRQRIRENGVEEETIFAGKVTDRELLAAAYARADLMLFPSLYDASSLVQIEAASQATPALYVRGAITADTVTENVNGFLAENDARAYAETILAILRDPAHLLEVSANAQRDLYLSWEDVAQKVLARYREICPEAAADYSY